MNRIEKAIKYVNKHKAKKYLYENRFYIGEDLKNLYLSRGSSFSFVKTISGRFGLGFSYIDYLQILLGIDNKFTEKQEEYFDWV
ncbi:MAG: hypothetical protein KAU58_01070 [Candidatus Omnitrophica bacterium]|nr:hypothetical protein [Candidatus Omnitrophota bacterium]